MLPIVVGVIIFIALTFGYFTPLLKGKVIKQYDMTQNRGMSKEIVDHRTKYNEEPLWTNSMFGGMPAYQISISYPSNLITPVRNLFMLGFPTPANMVFTYMMGFFILLLVLRVDRWLSIVGAIGFGFSAFFFLIIDAGHNTQALAIGYMAPVFAGVILVCRGKYLLGGAITAFFMAMEVLCNHVQITYYLVLALMIYVAFEWVARFRQKEYKDILKAFSVFLIAGVLAVGCNISNLWSTYEYAKSTIRGPSELTSDKGGNQTSGVDKEYATRWSMGVSETMTLMIPGFKGRASALPIREEKSALKNVEPQMKESVSSMGQYWGDQPGTSAPYSGAIIVFFFVLGLFIIQGRMKWALLTITIFSILLSWGKNFMPLTSFFLDYFPGYNKFRAVSMMLVLAEFAIPILAVLAIDKLLKTKDVFNQKIRIAFSKKEISVQKAFYISFGLTAGLSLLYFLLPGLSSFDSVNDAEVYTYFEKSNGAEVAQRFLDNLEEARKSLFRKEALRSFLFITLGAAAIWLYVKGTIGKTVLIPLMGVFILIDLALVDRSYLNDKNFTSKQEAKNPFPATQANLAILEDKDPNYRVLNISDPQGTFNDANTAYYHKDVGGYHAVKLRRYQELIEKQIFGNMQNIINTLRAGATDSSLRVTLAQQGVLNMLNTRYIIYDPNATPIQNRYALGNAWFVNELKWAKNADEEISMVGEINPARTAVIDERYKSELEGFIPKGDGSAEIKLTDYKLNHLKYESNSSSEQLAVFSEIFFKDGWNAYVDGELKPHVCANWILRAMRIPAGKHVIEFKFEPKKYYTGEKISLASCILLFAFVGGSLFMAWRKRRGEEKHD